MPAVCVGATGLRDVRQLAISPDGASVYTAGSGANSVGAYARNADSGALTFLGCITDDGTSGTNITPTPGCTPSTGLDYVQFVTVSPDGRHVYGSGTDVHTVAAFTRDPATGAIAALPAPGRLHQRHHRRGRDLQRRRRRRAALRHRDHARRHAGLHRLVRATGRCRRSPAT